MTHRGYWVIRFSGFTLVAIVALLNPPSPPHPANQTADVIIQIVCFAVVGLALVAWALTDEFPRYRRRGVPAALAVMAIASGVAGATAGGGQSLVAFACVATVGAGADIELPAAIGVAAAGILPIWIAGLATSASLGTLLGYPLLIGACLSLGRNRRSYRVQAEQAAALLEQYERARAEQRRADVLDERTRIAREIHDVLAHSLGALGIQIQAAKAVLTDTGDVGRAVEVLSTAQRMAADGLTETRRAVHALRVDTLPLGDELAAVVDTHRQRYQVPVTFGSDGDARPLPADASLALLRAAQEALVNAAKHAAGEPIAVRLDYGRADVTLTIVNQLSPSHANPASSANPTTISPTNPMSPGGLSNGSAGPSSSGGYGLTGMRERLRLLNGTLLAGPRDGQWALTAQLPLASADMNGASPSAAPQSPAAPGPAGR